ncbi:PREDICTED: uncharacterized protein LOC105557353 isoform X2 [Vollenhovia emeryi]|uniref:uncharacterized protein LOC105557353 isoform X2 n=1 Tax=Vollenhovia emeryi TaxID=411798 RepID=UPI0005F4B9A8|nr:PREDICTED: uncharacterized protein LOC105557353 isoform X2 [Vollenhovia emeryi]
MIIHRRDMRPSKSDGCNDSEKQRLVKELHAPARRNFPWRHVIVRRYGSVNGSVNGSVFRKRICKQVCKRVETDLYFGAVRKHISHDTLFARIITSMIIHRRDMKPSKSDGCNGSEKQRLVKELHAPARRNFPWRHVIVRRYDDL